jgi:hypothetical protein
MELVDFGDIVLINMWINMWIKGGVLLFPRKGITTSEANLI